MAVLYCFGLTPTRLKLHLCDQAKVLMKTDLRKSEMDSTGYANRFRFSGRSNTLSTQAPGDPGRGAVSLRGASLW